jgi:hypothetical protein
LGRWSFSPREPAQVLPDGRPYNFAFTLDFHEPLTGRVVGWPFPGQTRGMKEKTVVKQLYRLNVEPKVIDQLTRLAARTGEPKTRIATRLFTEAVMSYKPGATTKSA